MPDVRIPTCCTSYRHSHPEHHDRLLQVETDGIYGATELMELAVTWEELDYSDLPVIAPDHWPDFVDAHPWHDRQAVAKLVELALAGRRARPPRPVAPPRAGGGRGCWRCNRRPWPGQ